MRRRGRVVATTGLVLAVTVGCAVSGGTAPVPAPTSDPVRASASASPTVVAADAPTAALPDDVAALAAPAYQAVVSPLTPELAARMHASWRPGCPVPLDDLRYVQLTHRDMAGGVAQGELVVHADVADGVVEVFRALFDAGFPIASMRLVDDFGADDDASMAADNTSAFNCRAVTGGTGWSEHSYGRAIDVNPVENPYVSGATVLPPTGAAFVGRPVAPGVIQDGDVVVQSFAAHGWQWGGHWTSPLDYQHFSTTGR